MDKDCIRFDVEFAKVIRLYYARMQEKLAQVGLYRGQAPIMGLINTYDGMSQKEMAQALNLSPATVTVTLKRMEKAGLIVREMDTKDQRILRVHLSEQGKAMCQKGEEQCRNVSEELLNGFTEQEAAQLRGYLQRIAENMEAVVRKDCGDGFFEEEIGG